MSYSEIKFEDLQLFMSVVDLPNIARVAERFETTSSTISRRLKNMEEALGVRLIERTTRTRHVTPAGEKFYRHCQKLLEQAEGFSEQLGQQRDLPEGHITVYAPSELFGFILSELKDEFLQKFPGLRLEFVSGAGRPHLLEDNIDVMIHIDDPGDSSFVARKITTGETSFYASRDYIQRRGLPSSPHDLVNHDCIVEVDHERVARPWQIREGEVVTTLKINYRYSSDSITLCRILAEQGLGISVLPAFVTRESQSSGKLVQLFSGEYTMNHNVYAIYASRRYVPARIRTFIEFLAEHLPGKI